MPRLHRDWSRPCHICARTGLTLPHLTRGRAHRCELRDLAPPAVPAEHVRRRVALARGLRRVPVALARGGDGTGPRRGGTGLRRVPRAVQDVRHLRGRPPHGRGDAAAAEEPAAARAIMRPTAASQRCIERPPPFSPAATAAFCDGGMRNSYDARWPDATAASATGTQRSRREGPATSDLTIRRADPAVSFPPPLSPALQCASHGSRGARCPA